MNYYQLVKKSESISQTKSLLKNKIDIVYCLDDNYSLGAGVSLTSLLENNKNILINVYLFVIELSPNNQNKFIEITTNYPNLSLTIYHINNQFDINEDNKIAFPISAALRVIVPEILKDISSQFLYIDCDTLVTGPLTELIGSYTEKIIYGVEDYDALRHVKRLHIPVSNYFNSGVLLINTQTWCQHNITQKVLKLLTTKKFEFPDQDALNLVLYNNCGYLSKNLNNQVETSHLQDIKLSEHEIITHYLGQDKPWFLIFIPSIYRKYLNISPWRNTKLKLAPNARRIRVYSKRMYKINFLKSIILYFQYLYYKIVNPN